MRDSWRHRRHRDMRATFTTFALEDGDGDASRYGACKDEESVRSRSLGARRAAVALGVAVVLLGVRIGLERADFFGGTVNVAAKLQALADGSQIAMSESTYRARWSVFRE